MGLSTANVPAATPQPIMASITTDHTGDTYGRTASPIAVPATVADNLSEASEIFITMVNSKHLCPPVSNPARVILTQFRSIGMPIEAVFFDFMGTLAHYVPEQDEVLAQVCAEVSLPLDASVARNAFLKATHFWAKETAARPLEERTSEEKAALYLAYDQVLLRAVGLQVTDEEASAIFRRFMELGKGGGIELYQDVLPSLWDLKESGLKLGIISNMGRELEDLCRQLKLMPPVSLAVGSQEVGVTKPEPGIFHAALKLAEAPAENALYVGDQWDIDVLGARNAGMKAVLLDRYSDFAKGLGESINELGQLPNFLRLEVP